jgi:phosphatidylglycerol lysyltransferase
LAPSLAALVTFGLGVYMLMVSLIPSVQSSVLNEGEFIAALVIEGGTLLSAMIGVVLIILSHGLARQIRAAFYLTLLALGIGTIAALMNDFSIEAAAILMMGFALLLPFAGGFNRQAKLTEGIFSLRWFALVFGAGIAALGFFFFLHRATAYSNDLWTTLAHGANTPRALRAGLLASALLMAFTIFIALRPVRSRSASAAEPETLEAISTILSQWPVPHGCLAYSGDKHVVFSDSGKSFLMYGRQGGRFVAFGDPIGDDTVFEAVVVEARAAPVRDGAGRFEQNQAACGVGETDAAPLRLPGERVVIHLVVIATQRQLEAFLT